MHCKSYSHFFSKKFQHICVSLNVNFNESLTNDVVSFEQLGPGYFSISHVSVTSARDKVILNPDSARPKWGKPGETVLNVLQGVPLAEGTMASNTSGQYCFNNLPLQNF